jgi:hypothetical protein
VVSVTDATGKLVHLPASGSSDRNATVYIERDGANRAHRHHIQQHLVLPPTATFPRRIIFEQSEPAPMLPPARGLLKYDGGTSGRLPRSSAGVPCAGQGEVERSCELRGVARPGEESQCEGAARGGVSPSALFLSH